MQYPKALLFFIALYALPVAAQKTGIGTDSPVNTLSVVGSTDITDSLGIGIASPSKRLHVNGDAGVNQITVGRGGGNVGTNTALGHRALLTNQGGSNNTAAGIDAMQFNTSGHSNTAMGAYALNLNTTGYGNTAVGVGALQNNSTGYHNTAIGANARAFTGTLFNATAIGADAVANTSNSLVLGNNAKVGIGVTAPSTTLDVAGTIKMTSFQMTQGAMNGYLLRSAGPAGMSSWVDPASLAETDPEVGTISTHYVPRVDANLDLTNGRIQDNGTNVHIGGTVGAGARLTVTGPGTEGVRLLSENDNDYTAMYLGRASTNATIGIATTSNPLAAFSSPGDLVIRSESSTSHLILNNGAGTAGLAFKNGNVSLGTINHTNKLDVAGNLSIGTTYANTNAAPSNGAIIEGSLGIGSASLASFGNLRVSSPNAKTVVGLQHNSFFSTQEAIASNPFALRFSVQGDPDLADRFVAIQTTDVNQADGGNLLLQPENGFVGIGRTDPVAGLDVNGGIRTSYSGTQVVAYDNPLVCLFYEDCTQEYTFGLPVTLPPSWSWENAIVAATVVDGAEGRVVSARITTANTIKVLFWSTTGMNKIIRINWIIVKVE